MNTLLGNDGVAQAALSGLTIRVQRRAGAPGQDDPLESTVEVSGGQNAAVQQYAEDDLDSVLYGDPGLEDVDPMTAMMNDTTTNQTSYLENNYPLAAQANPSDVDESGLMAPPKTKQRASILAGLGLR